MVGLVCAGLMTVKPERFVAADKPVALLTKGY